ncbi:hypothetical protein CAI16_11125, partial [Virgibacillus dokdonensis]
KVVKDFQKYYGVNEKLGVAGRATLNKIDELLSSPLQNGKYNEATITLKKNLAKLGFVVPGNMTNHFGPLTEKVLKSFQSYYGLKVNGIADMPTLDMIKSIINSPLQNGKTNSKTLSLKKDLAKVGFRVSKTPNNFYGPITESVVKDFQKYYELVENGIADQPTLEQLVKILDSPLQNGKSHMKVINLKENLAKLGFYVSSNPTTYFGNLTEQALKQFQSAYNLPVSGIADEFTLKKIEELSKSVRHTEYQLTIDEAVNIQMTAGPQTDKKYDTYVSKNYIKDGKVTATTLNVRGGPGSSYWIVGQLSKGTSVDIIDEKNGWYQIDFKKRWVNASPEDVRYYLDPNNFINDEKQKFQFLDLARSSDVTASVLNNYLRGKGSLAGQGQAFIDASRVNGVNDIYLVSHAVLETGNGSSTLAQGVEYKGVTVYNMFGIGAYDSCPIECGVKRAYDEGWTTPYKAIVGGAKFIGDGYINNGQNTLYKMRWDPQAMDDNNRFGKQYATDIGWASKQVYTMYNLYQEIGSYNLYLDVPDYK